MNLLFKKVNLYQTPFSVAEFEGKVKAMFVSNYKGHNTTLTATINADTSFTLETNPAVLIREYGGFLALAKLNGTLTAEHGETIVEAIIRPNRIFLIMFYCFITMVLIQLTGANIFNNDSSGEVLLVLGFFTIVSYTILVYSCNMLESQFEKTFPVKRLE